MKLKTKINIEKRELECQLKKIKGYIVNCEFDLMIHFKDNPSIKNKLEGLQEQKNEIERKLGEIEE